MKKLFLMFVVASSAMVAIQSCKKIDFNKDDDKIVYQTVVATIYANETYTYALSTNTSKNPFRIDLQAAHYEISKLENNSSSYKYTPATDYTGSDKVILSNVKNKKSGGCGQNHHNSETQMVITININVKAATSAQ